MFNKEQLNEKWQPVLEHTDLPEIKDPYRRAVTSVLLENQEIAMKEQSITEAVPTNSGPVSGSSTTVAGFDPVLISLVRRSMPQLIAFDIAGVQPMTGPVGLIFAMKSHYTNQSGAEAGFDEADTDFSTVGAGGTASPVHVSSEPGILNNWNSASPPAAAAGTYTTGDGMTTAAGEALGDGVSNNHFPEMAFSITKTSVTARTRALKAEYSVELQQDLKAVHGLDAEGELANILSQEILGEINREVIRTIYYHAKIGVQTHNEAGIIDGTATTGDLTGRWDMEKFKEIAFIIEKEANQIGIETRRGKGTFVICSTNVASALAAAGAVNYLGGDGLAHHDVSGNTFVGTMATGMKVYVDPYSTGAYFVVGYRGTSAYDAGLFYCPYVPLQMVRAMGENTFQPKIAFKTRYGMVANPFAGALGTANNNMYYRRVKIENLL